MAIGELQGGLFVFWEEGSEASLTPGRGHNVTGHSHSFRRIEMVITFCMVSQALWFYGSSLGCSTVAFKGDKDTGPGRLGGMEMALVINVYMVAMEINGYETPNVQ